MKQIYGAFIDKICIHYISTQYNTQTKREKDSKENMNNIF